MTRSSFPVFLVVFLVLAWQLPSVHADCNSIFRRFSENHTLCLDNNTACSLQVTGVRHEAKQLILKLHNYYRNLVATGGEKYMPPAANMMELEWDDELAELAQAHANQCTFDHDCPSCRTLAKFPHVGQNLCLDRTTRGDPQPGWESCIKRWYDEVEMFPNSSVSTFQFDLPTGHFSQMVWAKTWKIGCGFARYPSAQKPFVYDLLYTCNYGPGGNVEEGVMYEDGEPCSHCPEGTCCGSGCEEHAFDTKFIGLCKATSDDGPTEGFIQKRLLWTCLFNNATTESCAVRQHPSDAFNLYPLFSVGYLEAVVQPGVRAEVIFPRVAKATGKSVCIRVEFRKGPNVAGEEPNHELKLLLTSPAFRLFHIDADMGIGEDSFQSYSFTLRASIPIQVGISFSVPENATAQYLDIYKVQVSTGDCVF